MGPFTGRFPTAYCTRTARPFVSNSAGRGAWVAALLAIMVLGLFGPAMPPSRLHHALQCLRPRHATQAAEGRGGVPGLPLEGAAGEPGDASWETDEDISRIVPLQPRAHGPDDDPPGAHELGLSAEEASFFKTNGFVVKRKLVEPEELEGFVQECWADAPAPVRRADRSSWLDVGEHWAGLTSKTSYRGLSHPSPNSEWRYHALGLRQDFLDASSAHPNVLHMVEAILGGPVKRPNSNRGVCAHPWPAPRALALEQTPHPTPLLGRLHLPAAGGRRGHARVAQAARPPHRLPSVPARRHPLPLRHPGEQRLQHPLARVAPAYLPDDRAGG